MKLLPSLVVVVLAASSAGCIIVRPRGTGYQSAQPQSAGYQSAQPQSAGGGTTTSSASGGSSRPSSTPTYQNTPTVTTSPNIPSSLEMHSDCSKTVPLFLGEKPKFGSGTKTSIGSNTTTTFPRHPDGTMTVWIIDDSENGLASAFASPTTRRITVGSNCTSLRTE
jgi:hypothetical protein